SSNAIFTPATQPAHDIPKIYILAFSIIYASISEFKFASALPLKTSNVNLRLAKAILTHLINQS
ncbi:hypothetical protein, partial [Phascolarctobacterium faecium]|uniref:hypothetical protein n=1 Tax=Phascolarctobacterium faecium TaxID=33025 RepID=UPI003AF1CB7B